MLLFEHRHHNHPIQRPTAHHRHTRRFLAASSALTAHACHGDGPACQSRLRRRWRGREGALSSPTAPPRQHITLTRLRIRRQMGVRDDKLDRGSAEALERLLRLRNRGGEGLIAIELRCLRQHLTRTRCSPVGSHMVCAACICISSVFPSGKVNIPEASVRETARLAGYPYIRDFLGGP